MASVARELAEVGLTADLAIARRDWDCIYTASERLLDLQRGWAALYRRLLVVRVQPSQISERTSVIGGHPDRSLHFDAVREARTERL